MNIFRLFVLTLFAFSAGFVHAAETTCSTTLNPEVGRSSDAAKVQLHRSLIELGLKPSIAERIVRQQPSLAKKIQEKINGVGLKFLEEAGLRNYGVSEQGYQVVYRGLQTHYYNPKKSDHTVRDIFFGPKRIATDYLYNGILRNHFSLLIEYQIPNYLARTRARFASTFSRGNVPDERLFISRIRVMEMTNKGSIKRSSRWFEYEEVFDENGDFTLPTRLKHSAASVFE